MSGDHEGDSTPAACPLGGAFSYRTFPHLCSPNFMKEIAPVEGNSIIALFIFPTTPHLLLTWEGGA